MTALAHAFVRPLLRAKCEAVRDAAARVSRSAGGGPVDPEAIHDYRVALRRLRTLLDASEPLFKRGPLARLRDGLRRFARTAGAVRDEEVLGETLGTIDLPLAIRARVDAWLSARARRERALRAAVIAQLARTEPPPPGPDPVAPASSAPEVAPSDPGPPPLPVLLDLAEALPLRRRAASISTRSLALSAVGAAAQKTLREAARPDAGTPERLHRLRIRYKGVRYTGELFSEAIARRGPLAEALAARVKVATRMQKRLGELHDLDEAIARVARARALGVGERMVVHHGLRSAREALLERLARELPGALSALQDDNGASSPP